jgi:DNA-binding beta-propeller fold protein YncE
MRVKRLLNIIFILILILSFPFISFSEEIYEYERMWPVLGQPWYFNRPHGLAVDSGGYVYVADTYNHRIQKLTSDGQFVTKWGSYGGGDGQFDDPSGIAIDGSGNVYVVGRGNGRIQKFKSNGEFVGKWGSYGSGDGEFDSPAAIAIDRSGYVYVADTYNHRIQKITSDGQFVTKWGSNGSGDGQFSWPNGVAVDSSGNVYVADTGNNRIQKFTSNGQFLTKWGSSGNGNDQLSAPCGIAVDSSGYVYVADSENSRVQKFTTNGQFVTNWGSSGNGDGQFGCALGITVDSSGNVYVTDICDNRIQKFTSNGQFISKWGSLGSGNGQFFLPGGMAIDSVGNVYVADSGNSRIQKFTSNGQFVTKWGSVGEENGQFNSPQGIAVDGSGYVFVVDTYNYRIQKFTSNGQFIAKWGSEGIGDGQFRRPWGIAIDSSGNVYISEVDNNRIQKFNSNGQFITKWGSEGSDDGQFFVPQGIAVDSSGNVYVADSYNARIQKFTSVGQFVTKWGEEGQFMEPWDLAVDSSGNIYVADTLNHRIQKLTPDGQFVTKWGSLGSNAGDFSFPGGIAVSSDGQVYVSDTGNNRIQVFKPESYIPSNKVMKAIVVAGSGPYKGNNLWDATEMNANFAYRVLTYQGYTNDTIYYLSSDRNLDLNGDRIPDVDADATNSKLQSAITQWANDAESLVLYLTGHGGDGTFRMSETETLNAEDLASWLDELQGTMGGLVTVIYDACESGSFVSKLAPPSEKQRILITSTSPGEPAYFLSQGALSFSYPFWSQIFSGAKIYDAYVMAKDVVGVAIGAGKSQNPEINDNGNGIGNEKDDGDLARNKYIGKGFVTAADIPLISTISQDQVLNGQTSATITVEVVSAENVTKVWGVVYSPNFINTPGSPITDLPSFDLTCIDQGKKKYEGTYNGFTVAGTYTITVYAMNEAMIVSVPKTTKVEQVLSNQYTLTVTIAPSNSAGSVSKSPDKSTYTNGETVTLTVSPNSGYTFTNWTGDVPNPPNPNSSIQIIMNGTKNVTANFIQNQYTLIVNINPPDTGLVSKIPDKTTYVYGDVVTLTATANAGYTLTNWSGDASGSTNPITLTMDGNKTVTANFTVTNGPDILVTPLTYDFGNVKVKKSKSASFKVQNDGKANLTIATLMIGPDASMFRLTSGGGNKTIKPGKFLTLKVTFKPTSKGSKQATLRITSNDPDTPLTDIPLSGTGQ